MTLTVRFAPSPTGLLHIGNLRTALFNALLARRDGGTFVLRLDDTDRARSREDYACAIEADLAWIGIAPDRIIRQSQRIERYDAAAARLRDAGLLYPCYETPDEIERKRKRLKARNLPPVYGRDALDLTREDREKLEAEGRRPHWRFLLPNHAGDPKKPGRAPVTWTDRVHGEQTVDLGSLSDPVLIREDGSYLYTLPSIVDDGAEGVSDVLRGDDHVTNTGVQIAIFEALGLTAPRFGHHNLLTTVDGEGLSKRSGALSLQSLREAGYEPMAVASLAVLLGMAGSVEALADLDALAGRLDLSAISASPSRFDPGDLDRLNADLVHAKPAEAVSRPLAAMGVPAEDMESFWPAVRANCTRVSDAAEWAEVVYGRVPAPDLAPDDAAFVATAADMLPAGEFAAGTWSAWTGALKAETGRKGKALFMPLRRALTGLGHGPELAALLPLIGRERAEARLASASRPA